MSKRVLLIANEYTTIVHFRMELISRLVAEGNIVAVAIPNHERNSEIKELGCDIIELPMQRKGTNPIKDLKIALRIREIIREFKPDIAFTFTIKPNVYGGLVCGLMKVPYVANITGLGTAVENGGIMQKITSLLYRLGLKKAQTVFFQNSENRDFMLKNKMVKGNYKLIPGSGVNVERFKLLEKKESSTINFVYIARVMKEKGIEQYFDAAKYITKKYPNTRFHICGPLEQGYEQQLNDLNDKGIVIYHGMVKNMNDIYPMVDCTVHPTFYPEGMSNVLLESAASGIPLITTDRSGCREIVEDGINGFIVKQKDSIDLIKKIEKFLLLSFDERKAMGIAGRTKVEREFNRNIVIEAYLSEINNLME